jgi:hypothetical protein
LVEQSRSISGACDVDEFLRAIIEVAGEVVAEEIVDLNWKQAQAIKKLVASCAR